MATTSPPHRTNISDGDLGSQTLRSIVLHLVHRTLSAVHSQQHRAAMHRQHVYAFVPELCVDLRAIWLVDAPLLCRGAQAWHRRPKLQCDIYAAQPERRAAGALVLDSNTTIGFHRSVFQSSDFQSQAGLAARTQSCTAGCLPPCGNSAKLRHKQRRRTEVFAISHRAVCSKTAIYPATTGTHMTPLCKQARLVKFLDATGQPDSQCTVPMHKAPCHMLRPRTRLYRNLQRSTEVPDKTR
jgi:hypothetical protein